MYITNCSNYYDTWIKCISQKTVNDCCKPAKCRKQYKLWRLCKEHAPQNISSER